MTPSSLEERFPIELSILKKLFGEAPVAGALPRLNQIHEYTEDKWWLYLSLLRNKRVRYLLIAEAPPWSATGVPQYVLDPTSRSRTLMQALRRAFLPPSVCKQLDAGEALAEFARQGLLIVDSIPFSMAYSKKRSSSEYDRLVQLTAQSYLQKKLRAASLSWSPGMRVAFSVKRNAFSVIEGLGHQLKLGEANLTLEPKQIAVNDANYPDAGKLKAAYALPNDNGPSH
jgi:hypothetical protein